MMSEHESLTRIIAEAIALAPHLMSSGSRDQLLALDIELSGLPPMLTGEDPEFLAMLANLRRADASTLLALADKISSALDGRGWRGRRRPPEPTFTEIEVLAKKVRHYLGAIPLAHASEEGDKDEEDEIEDIIESITSDSRHGVTWETITPAGKPVDRPGTSGRQAATAIVDELADDLDLSPPAAEKHTDTAITNDRWGTW